MSYTERLKIEIPSSVYETGCAITQALDPDVGGYDSWMPLADLTGYVTETPCTPSFKKQALQMLSNPALLHAAVEADYAARWADMKAPTLAECEMFCSVAKVIEEEIDSHGL